MTWSWLKRRQRLPIDNNFPGAAVPHRHSHWIGTWCFSLKTSEHRYHIGRFSRIGRTLVNWSSNAQHSGCSRYSLHGDRVQLRNRYQVKWLTLITTRAVIQIENKTDSVKQYTYELPYCCGAASTWDPCYSSAVQPSVIGDLSPTHLAYCIRQSDRW